MPLPSYARVTNLSNGRSLIVRVNDRGPYAANRIIDVSKHAAELLGFIDRGTTTVRVEYVGPAQLDGSDDRLLEATLRQDEPAPVPGSVRLAAATRIVPVAMTVPVSMPASPVPARSAVRCLTPTRRRIATTRYKFSTVAGSTDPIDVASKTLAWSWRGIFAPSVIDTSLLYVPRLIFAKITRCRA